MSSEAQKPVARTVDDLALWKDFPYAELIPEGFEVRLGLMQGKEDLINVFSVRHIASGKHVDAEWQAGLALVGPGIWLLPMVVALQKATKGESK